MHIGKLALSESVIPSSTFDFETEFLIELNSSAIVYIDLKLDAIYGKPILAKLKHGLYKRGPNTIPPAFFSYYHAEIRYVFAPRIAVNFEANLPNNFVV